MKILIQQVVVNDPNSPHHGTTQDILIDQGIISSISENISIQADQTIRQEGLHVSPGWIDVFAHFGDPGFEFKETLESGALASATGGYTDVFVLPDTNPVVDSKSQVEYIRHKSQNLPVNIFSLGAISKNLEGKELAEMYDMRNSGAIAFTDGLHPVQSAGLLMKALQYVKAFNGVIIQIPDDKTIGTSGLINEGIISTRLGLPGKPMMAEELIVARDIKLARYTSSNIHFTGVTSPRSLEYIRRAKDSGLGVTCSVTPYHLYFTDSDLLDYDTNLKVYPPLRTAMEMNYLREAVADGTVDCIATHHLPHEYDSKVLEFEYAKFGMIGLETSYRVIKTVLPDLPESRFAELFSINPGKIFGLQPKTILAENACSITLYNPGEGGAINLEGIRSRSKNTPFIGKDLRGKVFGIINGERVHLNN